VDASPPPSPAPEATDVGALIGGRYRLQHRIAGGGMASVWEAVDEVLTRRVAVKLLHPHLAADEQFVARFRREAVAVAGLSHPSIVSIYDTCSDGRTEAIVMELVRGDTLRAELDRRGRFEPADAVAVVAEIADALEAAHRAGVVHRDVKPANVLLSTDGRVLVADFGIAKAVDGLELTGIGTTLGTAKYLAPEQVEGAVVDGRADVYAAGVILYELLCGQPPFVAEHEAATALARLQRAPQPPRAHRPELSPELEQVVLRALARDPSQRYPTAGELRDALRAVGGSPAALAVTGPAGPGPPVAPPELPGADPTRAAAVDHTTAAPGLTAAVPAPGPALPAPPPPPPAPPTGGRPGPAPSPAQPSARRRRWGLGLTVGLVAASAVIAVALALQAGDPRPSGDAFQRDPAGSDGAATIAAVTTFDPPGGDGRERDDFVDGAIDDDDTTAWRSECYRSANFGNLKDGVGLVLELSGRTSVGALGLQAAPAGWSAQVHVADDTADTLDGWGQPVGTVAEAGSGLTVIEAGGAEGRFVLLFFTGLGADANPECPGDNPFAVTVSGLTVDED
jgi:serine/threonine-protein kinase